MSFDLASLDTKTLADEGVAMPIINPRTRLPEVNDDKTPVTITVLGRNSNVFQQQLSRIQTQRAEIAARGEVVTPAMIDKEDTATLIACTRGWTIQSLGGKPFPCTPQNVEQLWNDERFRGLRMTTMGFILNDANFLPAPTSGSDTNSADSRASPDTSSPSPVRLQRVVPSEMPSAASG